jgi:amino acid transporter
VTHTHAQTGSVAATLARGRIGTLSITWVVVSAVAPMTAIAGAVTVAYGSTGFLGIPLAYVVVLALLLLFSPGYLAMSKHIVNAGAFYTYIARGFGKTAGIAASGVAIVAYTMMEVGLIGGLGAVSSLAFALSGLTVSWFPCALVGWLLVSLIAQARVRANAYLLGGLVLCEIAVMVFYDVALLRHPAFGRYDWTPFLPTSLNRPGGILVLVGLLASFVGFEGTAIFAEEGKRGAAARATYLALGITGILYAVSAWALPVATGSAHIQEAATAHGPALIFDLVTPYVAEAMITVGHFLFLTSLFAGALAFHNFTSRYYYALGRDGVLFRRLDQVGRKSLAPRLAAQWQSLVVLAALVEAYFLHADPSYNLLFQLTVVAGFGIAILMAATSGAVVRFFYTRPGLENAWRAIVFPFVTAGLLLGILSGTVVQFPTLIGVPADSVRAWIYPSAFAALVLLGLAYARLLRRIRPHAYESVGFGTNVFATPTVQAPTPANV